MTNVHNTNYVNSRPYTQLLSCWVCCEEKVGLLDQRQLVHYIFSTSYISSVNIGRLSFARLPVAPINCRTLSPDEVSPLTNSLSDNGFRDIQWRMWRNGRHDLNTTYKQRSRSFILGPIDFSYATYYRLSSVNRPMLCDAPFSHSTH